MKISATPHEGTPAGGGTFATPTVGRYLTGLVVFMVSTTAAVDGRAAVWVTIPLNAAVIVIMFTVAHEALHHSISRTRWVNGLFGWLAWIFVAPMFARSAFTFIHLAHQRYVNDRASDPDAGATHGRSWQLPVRWAFTDVCYAAYYIRRLASRPARELVETSVMVSASAAAVTAAAVTGNLWTLAVVFLIPQRIAITVLAWWWYRISSTRRENEQAVSDPAHQGRDAPAHGVADDIVDVVVVGSGPAGCCAAMLFGRKGLRVALLEAHRDEGHYKRLCTHSIRSSALPTLQRLGLADVLEQHGGVRSHDHLWTRHGWILSGSATKRGFGYNISRRVLDPLLRSSAAGVPGVQLMLGARVTELTVDHSGRVDGVVADVDGASRRIRARLVVGADGYSSKVARLASLPAKVWRNDRFVFFAEYRNVDAPAWCTTALWLLEPDVAYLFRNEDDVVVLAAMPAKDQLPAFLTDRDTAIVTLFADLPDGPDLTRAQRVSEVIGTADYPSITRNRIVAPGVALIGDAATVGDPLWGTGCGWALQSAEWLCDAVADRLLSGTPDSVDAAARRYQRRHRRRLVLHQAMNISFSRQRRLNPVQRLLYAGAARDLKVADTLMAVGSRNRSPAVLASPLLLVRAAIASLRPAPVSARSDGEFCDSQGTNRQCAGKVAGVESTRGNHHQGVDQTG
ncbi:FAD-dependent monooxygenase [Mycobacterium sp.]|uniref:FAD-dependent monooxygenase n=1 Tax=Mycobacterium sp. TaxID=1785 RepID=UPI0031DBA757